MGFNARKAQQAGIDVQQVLTSWQSHLLADRDKLRDNPQLAGAPPARLCIAVKQTRGGHGVRWESLGGLPEGVDGPIIATGTSFEASRNNLTLMGLVEMRFRAELAEAMQRAGLYHGHTLEGRREAMQRALDATVDPVDMTGLV
jgi:hypothetical protein